ncbi:hypothetical protein DFH28DRAFT_1131235 [Melampsora americana]|nr:hypothetical protein DFH28DRAFT_1131235 [Melampsora americana]
MLGARTWYPAADERNGSYQLQKAEERANREHAENLMRIERLRESRLRRELSRAATFGGAHSVFPLAIGASGSSARGAPCAIHGSKPMQSSHPPQGNMPKQSQPMNGATSTGFQQGNRQQISSPQNSMQKMGQQNNMQKMGQQNNMQQMGQQNNMQKMGQQNNMQQMGQQNNMQQMGQQNNMQQMGQQNNMQQMGQQNNMHKMGQQNNMQHMGQHDHMQHMGQQNKIQTSGNNQQMNFQQSRNQKSGSPPMNMQQSNTHQMSNQHSGNHMGSQQGNKQSMGHQNMQKGDGRPMSYQQNGGHLGSQHVNMHSMDQHNMQRGGEQQMHFQDPIGMNKIQNQNKQQSGFDHGWSDGPKHKSQNGNQSFANDRNSMQSIPLKRSYSDSHHKIRNYPSSSRLSNDSTYHQRVGDNSQSLYSGLLDYDFHCDYHDRILLNEINRALMLPKLDEGNSGGRRRSSSVLF